jgi:long-chain acyl-CoA synthetase
MPIPFETIPGRLFDRAAQSPAAPAYYVKQRGVWVPTGYRLFADQVKRAGKALMALGCRPGSTVSILGFNRPEWVIFDLACMAVGGAPAGIYTTSSPSEIRYIVAHAESPVVLVENAEQWEKVAKVRADLPHLRWVVTMEGTEVDDPQVLAWDAFMARGEEVSDSDFLERLRGLKPGDLGTLIYTSGTTGPPKGVMLSHENLAFTAATVVRLTDRSSRDTNLSYLPLSHAAEQMLTIGAPITAGSAVYFAESIEKVPANLKEVRPTIFFAVPRIWEKFHAGIAASLAETKGMKRRVAEWAMSVGRRASEVRMRGASLPLELEAQRRVADKLVFSKLKQALGLDHARVCACGAAPLAKEVLEFFASLDLVIQEAYGMSENTGATTFNVAGRVKLGTVGTCVPGMELRLAEDGEILVRGPSVFLGYAKEPEAAAAALVDGWLHTGDLGALDAQGFLAITGRKKEIIITAGGKNISPANIEVALKNHPLIGEAVVIGDRRKFLTVLITLDADAAVRFRSARGADGQANLHEHPEILAEVQRALDAVNGDLARVEQVKKFHVLPKPFGVDTGELTPTLKVRRNVVLAKFAAEIESMYGG